MFESMKPNQEKLMKGVKEEYPIWKKLIQEFAERHNLDLRTVMFMLKIKDREDHKHILKPELLSYFIVILQKEMRR